MHVIYYLFVLCLCFYATIARKVLHFCVVSNLSHRGSVKTMKHTRLVVETAAGDCSSREGSINGVGCCTDRPPDPAATLRQCPSNLFVGPRLVRDTAHCGDRPQQSDSLGCRPESGSSHDSDGSQRSEVASKHHSSTSAVYPIKFSFGNRH